MDVTIIEQEKQSISTPHAPLETSGNGEITAKALLPL